MAKKKTASSSSKSVTASEQRLEAAKRLLPPAEKIYTRCLAEFNSEAKSSIKRMYKLAQDFTDVAKNSDKYGLSAVADLQTALGFNPRKWQRYSLVGDNISQAEFETYTTETNSEGRLFTFTHLVSLAGLKTESARKRAFERWKAQSHTTPEFEDYIQSLQEAPSTNPSVSSIGVSTTRSVRNLSRVADKLNVGVAGLAEVDFSALLLSGEKGVGNLLDSFRASLQDLLSECQQIVTKLENAGSALQLDADALDDIPEPAEGETTDAQPSKGVRKRVSVKKKKKKGKTEKGSVPKRRTEAASETGFSEPPRIAAPEGATGPGRRRNRGAGTAAAAS